jgi:hypothetical protein
MKKETSRMHELPRAARMLMGHLFGMTLMPPSGAKNFNRNAETAHRNVTVWLCIMITLLHLVALILTCFVWGCYKMHQHGASSVFGGMTLLTVAIGVFFISPYLKQERFFRTSKSDLMLVWNWWRWRMKARRCGVFQEMEFIFLNGENREVNLQRLEMVEGWFTYDVKMKGAISQVFNRRLEFYSRRVLQIEGAHYMLPGIKWALRKLMKRKFTGVSKLAQACGFKTRSYSEYFNR